MRRLSVVAAICAVLFISVGVSSPFSCEFLVTLDRVVSLQDEFIELQEDMISGKITVARAAVVASQLADQAELLFYWGAAACSSEFDANVLLAVHAPTAISMRLFAQGVAEQNTDKIRAAGQVTQFGLWLNEELQKLLGR